MRAVKTTRKIAAKAAPANIIMLGDPGAGKATQCDIIVARTPMCVIDMGAELRKLKTTRGKSAVSEVLKKTLDKGHLTPTDIVQGIFKEKISSASPSKGILFNGTPKMLVEAKLVARMLQQSGRTKDSVLFLYLSVPSKEIVARTFGRGRPDDTARALVNRAAYYRKNVAAVVKFFKVRYAYSRIDGVGTVAQVSKRILKKVNEFEGKRKIRS